MKFTTLMMATGIISMLTAGAFGAFGALVHYLFMLVKDDTDLVGKTLFAYMVMGFFVGLVMNEATQYLWGETYPGLVLVSGFLFLKILEFFDTSGIDIILRRTGIKDKNK